MPSVQSRRVQVTPNDGLFIVLPGGHCVLGDEPDSLGAQPPADPFGALHLATTREAAFGRCMVSYRPCFVDRRPLTERIDGYFGSVPEPDEVLVPGALPKSYFANRFMVELRPTTDAHFTDSESPRDRSPFPRHEARAGSPPRRSAGTMLGSRVLVAGANHPGWDYFAIWDEAVVRRSLEVYDVLRVSRNDIELRRAAGRLGIDLP